MKKDKILIAGIGGASLGTEIFKCLIHTNRYEIFGCDISEFAYGHYEKKFLETFLINPDRYVQQIKKICKKHKIQVILPGGEKPLKLLSSKIEDLKKNGIQVASNSVNVIKLCSDKSKLFDFLNKSNIPIPKTITISRRSDFKDFTYPCIVKPAIESGGSRFVFFANNKIETISYIEFLLKNKQKVLLQQYIPHEEGEFTVGVLSFSNRVIVGSIAMKRIFDSKLSISTEVENGLISSGYSQGLIREFNEITEQAEKIALKIKSEGPVNIQGRVLDGVFFPFEINPRFSASTYLRTLAGFNEIDIYLQNILHNKHYNKKPIKSGYYLRSFTEKFVKKNEIKND